MSLRSLHEESNQPPRKGRYVAKKSAGKKAKSSSKSNKKLIAEALKQVFKSLGRSKSDFGLYGAKLFKSPKKSKDPINKQKIKPSLIQIESKDSYLLITAAEFKAKCLKLMDEVAQTGKPLIITKRGRPVARLMPCESSQDKPIAPLYGCMKGTGKILGDIVSPMDDIVWNAMHD